MRTYRIQLCTPDVLLYDYSVEAESAAAAESWVRDQHPDLPAGTVAYRSF